MSSSPADRPPQLNPDELQQWQAAIAEANRHNILCHCKICDYEWVESAAGAPCRCGSEKVEYISCWQFPDG